MYSKTIPAAMVPTAAIIARFLLKTQSQAESQYDFLYRTATVFLGLITVYKLFFIFVYPFVFSPLKNLPEPKTSNFPWAHASQISNGHNGEPFRRWIEEVPNKGLIKFRVLFNEERILLTSPEALREVLVTKNYSFTKPTKAEIIFSSFLGKGLLVAEGDNHKRQRKLLMPAFSHRHLKDVYPIFWEIATGCVDAMAARIGEPKVLGRSSGAIQNTYDWASRVTLDIIGKAGFGYDFEAVTNPKGKIYNIYHDTFTNEPPILFWINVGIWFPVKLIMNLPLDVVQAPMRNVKIIKAFAMDLIHQKREKLEKSEPVGHDILSTAMQSGGFSDEDLMNQILTFLAAGHETTASALTWACHALASHPECQERLRKEVTDHLTASAQDNEPFDPLSLDRLPYLNAVCNEVLRLVPSVPMTIRVPVEDVTIQGQFIPKGTAVVVAAWATNASKELWGENAAEFYPDRWIINGKASNSGGAVNNFANLTFIHGPRSCIGKDFARSELLCLIAAWVQRFEISPTPESDRAKKTGWVTLRPDNQLPLKFKDLKQSAK